MKTRTNNTIQAFWVGIGNLSSTLLAIVSAAILARYFDKNEYGTYKQIIYVYTTLLVVFTAGLPRCFAYFLPRYSLEEGKEIVWKISKVLFFLGITFSIILYLASGMIALVLNNPELENGLKLFSITPALLLPTLGLEGVFSTYKKTMYLAVFNIISKIAIFSIILFCVFYVDNSYKGAIYGWVISSFFVLIIALYFKNIPFKGVEAIPSNLKYSEILKYSIPLVIASLSGVAIFAADQFYISKYFGPAQFAEYSNGFTPLPFVGMITGSASIVLMPIFSKLLNKGIETSKLLEIWNNTILKSALLIYPLVIFFMYNSKAFVVFMYSEKYIASAKFFQLSLIVNFFSIILFTPLILAFGKTKFYALLHLFIAILIWTLDFILVKFGGTALQISLISIIVSILKIIIVFYYSSKLLNVTIQRMFPFSNVFKILFHSILTMLVVGFFLSYTGLKSEKLEYLIVASVLYSLVLLLTSKIFNLDYLNPIQPILRKIRNV